MAINKTAWKERAWVVLLGLLTACWAMAGTPLGSVPRTFEDDMLTHSEAVGSMREALSEGQFPPREAPRVRESWPFRFTRYPFFQFYSSLPYALASVPAFLGLTFYHALVAAVFLSFVLGFIGAYQLCRVLGASLWGALACGAGYTLAPYHLADWYARTSFPELAAFGFMPFLFLGAVRTFREPGKGPFLLSVFAWCAMMMSHHIFHVWSLVFLAVFLAHALLSEKGKRGSWARAAGAYVLACLACGWTLFPSLVFGPHLIISRFSMGVSFLEQFVPRWDVLFSPFRTGLVHVPGCSGDSLCLQLGWPLLAGVLLLLFLERKRALREPLFSGFLLSCLGILYLYPVWSYLGPLTIVQFSYRLMMYAALFSSLAAGLALDRLRLRVPALGFAVFLLVCALWFSGYRQFTSGPWSPRAVQEIQKAEGTWIRTGYALQLFDFTGYARNFPAVSGSRVSGDPQLLLFRGKAPFPKVVQHQTGQWSEFVLKNVTPGTLAMLPVLYYPLLYQVRINGQKTDYGYEGNRLAVQLPGGDVAIRWRFAGLPWANVLSLAVWIMIGAWMISGLGVLRPRRATREPSTGLNSGS